MATTWGFLTIHARALLLIARNADARLRDIASAIDVTERTAYTIVADLAQAGYVIKERDGRRNRYHIQEHLPLPTTGGGQPTIGELLGLLSDAELGPSPRSPAKE
ncbi:MAG: helix-turn-helix domain-containing protein [Acidimicrobiia bacterium]|nr:helix-turn-helix domain-containing protein [Acidimicrobiia bacterium]